MRVGFLIIARLKSTRLRQKALLEAAGRPILGHMFDRLRSAGRVSEIVLCTSDLDEDDPLEGLARAEGVSCFRGHPSDVLQRLHDAATAHRLDYILHITGDSPFADPVYCDRVVEAFETTGADLITTFDLPHGAFIYGIKPASLAKVLEIKDDVRTEVWGRYFTHTDLFTVHRLEVEPRHCRPEIRLTLDYPEDYQVLQRVFGDLHRPGEVFSLDELIAYLDAHPEVLEVNQDCARRYCENWLRQAEIRLKPRHEVSRAAVIGAGSIGRRHMANLSAVGIREIVALRTHKGHLQDLDPELGVTQVGSFEELEQHRPHVAVISNPTSLHLETLERLLGVTRGILIEKPLSHSLDGLPRLLEAVHQARAITFVAYNLQFHPIVRRVSQLLAEGRLGRALSCQCSVGHWLPDWHPGEDHTTSYAARQDLGGGAALTLIHEVQMALGWLGPATSVAGTFPASPLLPLEVDVIADLMLRHEGGGVSQLHLDLIQRPWHREGVVCCERGWIRYDFATNTVCTQADGEAEPSLAYTDRHYDLNECYREMMATFLRFVREGRVRHAFDAWQGCLALGAVAAAHTSAAEERWVPVPAWIGQHLV